MSENIIYPMSVSSILRQDIVQAKVIARMHHQRVNYWTHARQNAEYSHLADILVDKLYMRELDSLHNEAVAQQKVTELTDIYKAYEGDKHA